jgi:hypothetical protein
MTIDGPVPDETIRPGSMIGGWALERGAATGTGVDAVHVWAYPIPGSGQSPVFVGAAQYGGARPDVGAAFGSQFTNAGFTLVVPALSPGNYLLVAFPHSTLTNGFEAPATVRVTVGGSE